MGSMLVTPRTYSASQTPDQLPVSSDNPRPSKFHSLTGWRFDSTDAEGGIEMLLIRQSGSVRVGEVVRYTLTYTPAADSIRPTPTELHVKIKNTSAVPLRAAYLHGPYTLYASCYPSTFDPDVKQQDSESIPQFEPYLKAGGSWNAVIPIPKYLRRGGDGAGSAKHITGQSVTWVIEIISQIIFSSTASVNFELLVGRDEASTQLLAASGTSGTTTRLKAAQLSEHWSSVTRGKQVLAVDGVFCDSITLLVDDTSSLWNTPCFPSYDYANQKFVAGRHKHSTIEGDSLEPACTHRSRKKVHLVVLTHGLHSNLGADMLYLKDSIDAAVRRAARKPSSNSNRTVDDPQESDEEQVIVRGFPGNSARTERGIQYLGKRLAKYVLLMTYPDQPYIPPKNAKTKNLFGSLVTRDAPIQEDLKGHTHSAPAAQLDSNQFAYQITSISFVGHSLGGLVQTYAIAYIQKYSPDFFSKIKPINFIALATPFLGLSNENPMYVRFALDLGLVGRTGQDLGLSWTAPRARSGWDAIIGGKGKSIKSQGRPEVGTKPLLRILPCGPAHEVLARFQRRTLYSNLVNDGIVPLRTSCLLFLDWKGLGRVEKTKRENGLVGIMAEWTWAELTGANSKSSRAVHRAATDLDILGTTQQVETIAISHQTPATASEPPVCLADNRSLSQLQPNTPVEVETNSTTMQASSYGPLDSLFSIFRPKETDSRKKQTKVLMRSQTATDSFSQVPAISNSDECLLHAPPRTTLLESASDLLVHPLPPTDFIMDPESRPPTIFHDRIYHPEDIPAPNMKHKASSSSSLQFRGSVPSVHNEETIDESSKDESGVRVEEKIARAYHNRLSWRKVLVRLEPDAHNNIIVRRMFTNAYGWPVVKHLVETHFGSSSLANHCNSTGHTTEN